MTQIKGGMQIQVGEPRTPRDVENERTEEARQVRFAQWEQAVSDIERALAAIEAQARQPDQWERASLAQAIDMLSRGAYGYASRFVDLAMTPADARSHALPASPDPRYDRLGLHSLKACLDDARTQPLRADPHFEPVQFRIQPET